MKQLLLIRHGKSDWDHPGVTDHDRPLNERGLRDAPRIAKALLNRGIHPGVIVTSTARRAASTAAVVAKEMGYPAEEIVGMPELYLASPATILRVVQQLDESVGTALLFGHNPGMHEAVNLFSGGQSVEDFPTLAVSRIELNLDSWGETEWELGRNLELIVPRGLAVD